MARTLQLFFKKYGLITIFLDYFVKTNVIYYSSTYARPSNNIKL